jgi:uncharacterized protein YkwD
MVSRSTRLLLAVLIVGACSFPAPDALAAAAGAAGAAITNSIADLTNIERSRVGVSPLRVDGRLMKAAQLQAEQMATLGRMDHVLSNGPYPAPQDRLAAAVVVAAARGRHKTLALRGQQLQRGVEHLVDLFPEFRVHKESVNRKP